MRFIAGYSGPSILALAFTSILVAQTPPVRLTEQVEAVVGNRIARRAYGIGESFAAIPGLPPLPSASFANASWWWDGFEAYQSSAAIISHATEVRAYRFLSGDKGKLGRWELSSKGLLPESAEPILVVQERVFFQVHHKPDPGNHSREGVLEIGSMDLASRHLETLLSLSEHPGFIRATALNLDGDALIFLNTGVVGMVRSGDHLMRSLVDDFWASSQPDVFLSMTQGNGETVYFSPKFLVPPFLFCDGRVGLVMGARHRTHWTKPMMQAQFDALTPEAQDKAIRAGGWPPPFESYDGSEFALVGISYDPATQSCSPLKDSELEGFGERERFTRILVPSSKANQRLRTDGQDRIMPSGELR